MMPDSKLSVSIVAKPPICISLKGKRMHHNSQGRKMHSGRILKRGVILSNMAAGNGCMKRLPGVVLWLMGNYFSLPSFAAFLIFSSVSNESSCRIFGP